MNVLVSSVYAFYAYVMLVCLSRAGLFAPC
jgi:hypothetical protein